MSELLAEEAVQEESAVRPAPVSLERVDRFFALMCELGFADVIDAAHEKAEASRRKAAGKATKKLSEALKEAEPDPEEYVSINFGKVLSEMRKKGRFAEMGMIIFEGEEEDIKRVSMREFRTAFFPFARESWAGFNELVAFGASLG